MEMPFKYIVFYIMKILNDRGMPLSINKSDLINFFNEILKKGYFTVLEKKELMENFDFEYELDNLINNEYPEYFSYNKSNIVFDVEYALELEELLYNEAEREEEQGNKWFIFDIVSMINYDTDFLEIVGVKINKELYNYLLDMDKNIEKKYRELLKDRTDTYKCDKLTLDIRKLIFKRMILMVNTKNVLSDREYNDLVDYSFNVTNKNIDYDGISFLLDDEDFDETDILEDLFKRSIFTYDDLYFSSLSERFGRDILEESKDTKYSIIKFYLTFLDLLEKEIDKNTLIREELLEIKYRIMFAIDISFDTTVIMNRDNILDGIEFKEGYIFNKYAVYYFIKEILMYDDKKYKNEEYETDNMMLYIDNLIKKIFIETYYKLTLDKGIVNTIKENKMYGVNEISSSLLREIVDKPKTRTKEV